MKNLSIVGRIFYGIAIAGMGIQTICTHRFPYMMIPPGHAWIPAFVACIFGAMLVVAGICIVFGKKATLTPILLGFALLLIFCFYFIPYQFMAGTFKDFGEWENAEKELALSGGAFIIVRMNPLGMIFISCNIFIIRVL